MKVARFVGVCFFMVATGVITSATPAAATALDSQTVVSNTDFASFGVGGMREIGSGSISVSGITGTVTQALLYWNGPTNGGTSVNAAVNFNGSPITGTNIGTSSDNCWGFNNSQSYRAVVTSNVKSHTGGPNGTYSLSGFLKTDADINGVSLIVFFNDGNISNNRNVTIVDGNDSNVTNGNDSNGWNAIISDVGFSSGTANLQLHVGDGQSFTDGAVTLNDSQLVAPGHNFEGDSVPGANYSGNGSGITGNLWDIKHYDITSFMSTESPSTTLDLSSPVWNPDAGVNDCLSLVVATVDTTPTSDSATGFCSGATTCSISTDTGAGATPADPTVSTITISANAHANPQTITMSEASSSTLCRGPCDGQVLTFTSSASTTFSGVTDPNNPVVLTMIWDRSVKQGSQVFIDEGSGPKLVAQCTTRGIASPHPCVSQKNVTTPTGDRLFTILLIEGDPSIGKH